METRTPLHNAEPKYNVKAVARLVGISAVTLRAWERRYGLPKPQRGVQGYRLYSEHDIRTLRWLKARTEAGMSISRAAQHLGELRAAGRDPAALPTPEVISPQPASTANLCAQCITAWAAFDESGAVEIMRLAFSLYPVDRVLVEVIQPALIELGEGWHRGEISLAAEHFATQFCLRHLMSILAAVSLPSRPGVLIAACAPGEHHEIGLLIIVVILRWRGWNVCYLGPNLSLDGILQSLGPLHPRVLLFSATRPESAEALRSLPDLLSRFPVPPMLVLGGKGFSTMTWSDHLPGIYLDASPMEMVEAIEVMMQDGTAVNRGHGVNEE